MSPTATNTRSRLPQTFTLLVLGIAVAWTTRGFAQGNMQAIRDDVRPGPSSDSDDDDHHHRHKSHDCDDDGIVFGEIFAKIWAYLITSPFWGPHGALDDSFSREGYFARFPYDGVPGHLLIQGRWTSLQPENFANGSSDPVYEPMISVYAAERARVWSCRLRAEYTNDLDDVSRLGAHMLLTSTARFGIDTGFDYFQEELPGGSHDHLTIGDFNVVFRFAQSEHVEFRSGLGFNWMTDDFDSDYGFNFTYGADFFPCKPWVISATMDWGTLGRTGLFHFRTTAGVVFHGLEAYTGYEYHAIGSTRINGLVGGVRVWF